MHRYQFFRSVLGDALAAFGILAFVFTCLALVLHEPWAGFALASVALPGGLLLRRQPPSKAEPGRHETAVTVLLLWGAVSLLTSVPYVVQSGLSFTDSVFEAVSGFSTTGSTVITELALLPRSLVLWRAVSQWVGGIGILVMFVAVFPTLAIAGRQLFLSESPIFEEQRIAPRLRQIAGVIISVYGALTVLCTFGYVLSGLSLFDALAFAFATVGAGGFSPIDGGFGALQNTTAEWVAIVFMFLAGVSFPLLFRTARNGLKTLFKNTEFRAYVGVIVLASAAIFVALPTALRSLRQVVFHVVSILTSTGFATLDYTLWPAAPLLVLLGLMFIGASVGSAAGGIKVLRWVLLAKNVGRELKRTLAPRAVLPITVGKRIIPDAVIRSVIAFVLLYVATFIASGFALLFTGLAPAEAFTLALAHLSNTGPAVGAFGPLGNTSSVPIAGKWTLIITMIAGRLEVVTLFVALTPLWWRHR